MAAPISLPVTYPASKLRMLWLLALCSAFVAIGAWMYHEESGGTRVVAGLIVGFFGCGILVALVSLLPRASYLTLNESGLEYASLFRRHFVAWKDVARFMPIVMHSNRYVAWAFAESYDKQQKARSLSVALAGVEAMLPDTYGHSNVELAALLNELRARFGK